jgi:hypothetical protein
MRTRCIIRMLTLIAICTSTTFTALSAATVAAAAGSQFFPATGHTVSGPFLAYWQANGGLAIFGNPIGEAQTERETFRSRNALIQWFERARFELHPERAGTPYEVELSLLGSQATYDRLAEPAFQPIAPLPNTPDATFFPQTSHKLSAGFKQFWEATTGTILSDAGAGNIGCQVPAAISATQTDGTMQRFYGCYLLHRVNVPIEDTMPPYPIALRAAHIIAAPASADPAALLAQADALVQGGLCTQ